MFRNQCFIDIVVHVVEKDKVDSYFSTGNITDNVFSGRTCAHMK